MIGSKSSGSTEVDNSGFLNNVIYSNPDNYVSNPSYYDDYYSYNTGNSSSEIANNEDYTENIEEDIATEGYNNFDQDIDVPGVEATYDRPDGEEGSSGGGESNWFNDAYNSVIGRMEVPDFLAIGIGFNGIAGGGVGSSIEERWVTHGPEASWKPMITVTQSVGGGYSVDATLNIEVGSYIGNVNNIRRRMMLTSTPDGGIPTIWGSGGVGAGGKIGVTGYITPNAGGSVIIGGEVNFGFGLPPGNGAGGVSNTWILYDFK